MTCVLIAFCTFGTIFFLYFFTAVLRSHRIPVGIRGLLLDELAHSFDLVVANSDGDGEQHWAFESSMGVRRRIDFVLCNRSLHLRYAVASFFLGIWGQIIELLQLFSVWPKWDAVCVEHILKQKGGNHSLMKMVILPYITCS